jgi:anti-sigma factor RsiW
MKDMDKDSTCERVADLIDFLYGELSAREAQRFEHHLRDCSACTAEFTAFKQVRTSVVEWRNEWLRGILPVPAEQFASAPVQSPLPAKRSAIVALREFFALSPLWLRGAAAMASVLFCACAVLAIAYLKNRQPNVVLVIPDNRSTQKQAPEALAVEQSPNATAAQKREQLVQDQVVPHRITKRTSISPGSENARASRPFSPRERQELATDLRIVTAKEEDDLDFTTDPNRPTP